MEEKPTKLTPMQEDIITALNGVIQQHFTSSVKINKDVATTKTIDFIDFVITYIQCLIEEVAQVNREQAATALLFRLVNLNPLQYNTNNIELPKINLN